MTRWWPVIGGLVLLALLVPALGLWSFTQATFPVTRIDADRQAVLVERTAAAVDDVNHVHTPVHGRSARSATFDGCPIDDSGGGLLPYTPTFSRSWKALERGGAPAR